MSTYFEQVLFYCLPIGTVVGCIAYLFVCLLFPEYLDLNYDWPLRAAVKYLEKFFLRKVVFSMWGYVN